MGGLFGGAPKTDTSAQRAAEQERKAREAKEAQELKSAEEKTLRYRRAQFAGFGGNFDQNQSNTLG